MELLPTRHCSLLQFVFATDDLEGATLRTVVDGQSQTPVAFLGDHPIIHIPQPVQFTLQAKGGDPGDLAHDIHDLVAEILHGDEPFIDQTEDEFGTTSPAGGIAVFVVLWPVEQALLRQILGDLLSNLGNVLTGEPIVAWEIDAKFVYRSHNSQVELFGKAKVFAATAGSDMNDTRTLTGTDLFPGNDGMYDVLLGGQFIEGATIAPTNHLTAFEGLNNIIVTLITTFEGLENRSQVLGQVIILAVLL